MREEEPSENLSPVQSFGLDVRQVRKARGMTMKGLGSATGYSEGYVSKVEAGRQKPSGKFASGCDHAFGTGTLFARQLRRALAGDHPSWFVPYVELELKASRIYDYSVAFIMGMLQTAEYARAVFRTEIPPEGDEVIENRVVARIGRHEVMEREVPPRLWVVLHEACLRTVVGGREVMARQLEYLAREAESPHITLQILPFEAGPPATGPAFTLLAFDDAPTLLHTEGPHGGRPYEESETVTVASDKYDRLRADALSPRDSVVRIMEIAKEYAHEQRRSSRDVGQVQLQRPRGWPVHRVGPRVRISSRRRSRS